ncbi:thiamine-phosphate kinase [bacterium]|nr:thiamine-phosphate kinase [bacterium]
MNLEELGEGGLVELIKEWTGPARGKVRLTVGDDAAVIDPSGTEQIVVSTDAFVEGVHFSRSYLEGNEIGHRIMAGTLSDLAAMAARGIAAFVNVHAPPDTPVDFLRDVYMGFERVAGPLGVVIAGGDTVRGELAFDITALGLVPIGKAVGRSGARDGDRIFVSGQLGLAETGRRSLAGELSEALPPKLREEAEVAHRQPRPRFDVARLVTSLERRSVDVEKQREIVEAVRPTAMIDISDGLAVDLSRLCEAGNVGCRLEERLIPVGPAARRAARLAGLREMEFALGGGDDYELLFTIPPADEELLVEAARNVELLITCVGTITSQRDGRYLVLDEGTMERLPQLGWDHFAASSARTP